MASFNEKHGGNAATVTLIRGADLVASPWKNGGGVTREIAAFPECAALDSFVWRVSIADVAQAGPFSRFAGIDRTLVLLEGAGMLLDETQTNADGVQSVATHALTKPLDVARFTGEAPIDARLVSGTTRDFNLMVRRGAAIGTVETWRGGERHTLSADVVLLHCASGGVAIAPGAGRGTDKATLEAGDTLRIDAPAALPCAIEGEGALLAISIRYTQR